MTNYLALIRKADFTDLFKYGRLHINNDMKTDFSCSVEELPSHPEVFHHLTHFANSFDSAFAYLIIHYVKASSNGLANDVNIEEVQNIYPLDFESKEAFAMSFDERIRIENPIWPESVWSLQKQQQFSDCLKGAANLREILGFKDSDYKCKEIISDDIVREVVNELYDDIRPSGNLSIWVYLLRYERHSFYPQNVLGCFMDMANVVCNRQQKQEVDESSVMQTNIYRFLTELRKNEKHKIGDIHDKIIDSPELKIFLEKTREYEPQVDFTIVATLFFYLKYTYKEDFHYKEKDVISISSGKEKFGFEFELAAYLLGIIKGHLHTYDCMYDMLPLPIFKKASNAQSLSGSHTNNGQESSESKDSQESKETSEPKDVPETKKETPEPKDSQESKETFEPKDAPETKETSEPKDAPETKETSEPKDAPEIKKETPEPKDSQESKETSEPKDVPEIKKETPEPKDSQESKETSEPKDVPEIKKRDTRAKGFTRIKRDIQTKRCT